MKEIEILSLFYWNLKYFKPILKPEMESKIKLKIFVSLIWNSKNRLKVSIFFQFFIRKIKTLQLNHSNKESLKCSWLLKNHHMDAISICQFATSRLIQKLVLKIISENFTFNKSRGFSVRKISALYLSSLSRLSN